MPNPGGGIKKTSPDFTCARRSAPRARGAKRARARGPTTQCLKERPLPDRIEVKLELGRFPVHFPARCIIKHQIHFRTSSRTIAPGSWHTTPRARILANDPKLGMLVYKLTLFREIPCSPGVGMPHATLKWDGNSKTTLNWEFPLKIHVA
jgi:hypothetical protein